MEDLRKTNPNIKYEDILKRGLLKPLKDVLINYKDGKHYINTFLPLI